MTQLRLGRTTRPAAASPWKRLWARREVLVGSGGARRKRAELRQLLDRPANRAVLGAGGGDPAAAGSSAAGRWVPANAPPSAPIGPPPLGMAAASGDRSGRTVRGQPIATASPSMVCCRCCVAAIGGVPLRWASPSGDGGSNGGHCLALDPLRIKERQALISLVPTQLHRLMADPAGLSWLRGFCRDLGGRASLAPALAAAARSRPAPSHLAYGATETAAMVAPATSRPSWPARRVAGAALADVELRPASGGR